MKKIILAISFLILFGSSAGTGQVNKIWVPEKSGVSLSSNAKTTTLVEHLAKTNVPLLDPHELQCLSKNIYFEAAVESTAGKLAVAQVTMNRVNSERYPNTVCEVITQGKHYSNGFPVKDRCQFSWYCDGKHDEPPTRGSMWKESQEVAKYILTTPDLIDITDGATHYHADYISSPRWAHPQRRTVEIDTHIFYNKSNKSQKLKIYKGKKT